MQRAFAAVLTSTLALGGATGGTLPDAPWFAGIDSIKVFSPGDAVAGEVSKIYSQMQNAQFSSQRYAVLLRPGNYGSLQIPLGYYTSVVGVGESRKDVVVQSFYSNDLGGKATDNFWRSVEGLTATGPSIAWATSQACPIRRTAVQGDLHLSESGWSSGGFLGDVIVGGSLETGTQQQFVFRNSRFGRVGPMSGWNFVFVGVDGAPASIPGKPSALSVVGRAPVVAEKPYLVEKQGQWFIAVPPIKRDTSGPSADAEATEWIAMQDVYVAKAGDTSASINKGIANKKALLLAPGVYGLAAPLAIARPGFVVLGLGFPTLVPRGRGSAVEVRAAGVRLAGVLLEANAPEEGGASAPLLLWTGPGGVASDIFTRAAALQYALPGFRSACARTRADVHVQLDGQGTVVDNTWFWHADHDDCGGASDNCYSGNGLVVHASQVVVYGLQVEHTMGNLVDWYGEDGQVFFFQSELPYHDMDFGASGKVGYKVADGVRRHSAVGLGVYIIGGLQVAEAFRVPAAASMQNMLAWSILGSVTQFKSIVCTGPGQVKCYQGDRCVNSHACYLSSLPDAPPAPSPTPSPSPSPSPCAVGASVRCPGSTADCQGRECCPDGSVCPSAPADFQQCPRAKLEDCTAPGPLAAGRKGGNTNSSAVSGASAQELQLVLV